MVKSVETKHAVTWSVTLSMALIWITLATLLSLSLARFYLCCSSWCWRGIRWDQFQKVAEKSHRYMCPGGHNAGPLERSNTQHNKTWEDWSCTCWPRRGLDSPRHQALHGSWITCSHRKCQRLLLWLLKLMRTMRAMRACMWVFAGTNVRCARCAQANMVFVKKNNR